MVDQWIDVHAHFYPPETEEEMCGEIHLSTQLPDEEPVQWLVFARSLASKLFWKAGSSSDE